LLDLPPKWLSLTNQYSNCCIKTKLWSGTKIVKQLSIKLSNIYKSLQCPPVLGIPLILFVIVLDKSMGNVLDQHDRTRWKEHAIYYLSKEIYRLWTTIVATGITTGRWEIKFKKYIWLEIGVATIVYYEKLWINQKKKCMRTIYRFGSRLRVGKVLALSECSS